MRRDGPTGIAHRSVHPPAIHGLLLPGSRSRTRSRLFAALPGDLFSRESSRAPRPRRGLAFDNCRIARAECRHSPGSRCTVETRDTGILPFSSHSLTAMARPPSFDVPSSEREAAIAPLAHTLPNRLARRVCNRFVFASFLLRAGLGELHPNVVGLSRLRLSLVPP